MDASTRTSRCCELVMSLVSCTNNIHGSLYCDGNNNDIEVEMNSW